MDCLQQGIVLMHSTYASIPERVHSTCILPSLKQEEKDGVILMAVFSVLFAEVEIALP